MMKNLKIRLLIYVMKQMHCQLSTDVIRLQHDVIMDKDCKIYRAYAVTYTHCKYMAAYLHTNKPKHDAEIFLAGGKQSVR